ncbi:MAG TPA: glycosyltransferase, partial [Blastocatellia bacterium]|nr:glycosyltransferase [Blastocatellia bacterium]
QLHRGSFRYKRAQYLESVAVKRAEAIVTNSSSLRSELVSRGISPQKLFEVLNGVDTQAFHPQPPDADLIERYGLWGKTVIGFIGSFYEYEGLDQLITAMLSLLRTRHNVALLLVGSGEAEAGLRARIPREWRGHFIFAGHIEQEDIPRYYSVMDLLVYPRKSTRLTELTSSTRPLEAMAMERTVIASSIGGMCEVIRHGQTGFLVEPENTYSLAALIARLAGNRSERRTIGRQAREYVVEHRDWNCIAGKYLELYHRLLKHRFPRLHQMPERPSQDWPTEHAPEREIRVRIK